MARHPRSIRSRAIPGRMLPLAVAAVSVVALAPAASADGHGRQGRFTPGASGVGDPYFPLEGNGGYDVRHYSLDLRYDPDYDQLDGTVTVTARATQNLSRFDLDLSGMDVDKVWVDRHHAARGPAEGTDLHRGDQVRRSPADHRGLADRVRLPVRVPAHARRRVRRR
jgi:hypothetical protein